MASEQTEFANELRNSTSNNPNNTIKPTQSTTNTTPLVSLMPDLVIATNRGVMLMETKIAARQHRIHQRHQHANARNPDQHNQHKHSEHAKKLAKLMAMYKESMAAPNRMSMPISRPPSQNQKHQQQPEQKRAVFAMHYENAIVVALRCRCERSDTQTHRSRKRSLTKPCICLAHAANIQAAFQNTYTHVLDDIMQEKHAWQDDEQEKRNKGLMQQDDQSDQQHKCNNEQFIEFAGWLETYFSMKSVTQRCADFDHKCSIQRVCSETVVLHLPSRTKLSHHQQSGVYRPLLNTIAVKLLKELHPVNQLSTHCVINIDFSHSPRGLKLVICPINEQFMLLSASESPLHEKIPFDDHFKLALKIDSSFVSDMLRFPDAIHITVVHVSKFPIAHYLQQMVKLAKSLFPMEMSHVSGTGKLIDSSPNTLLFSKRSGGIVPDSFPSSTWQQHLLRPVAPVIERPERKHVRRHATTSTSKSIYVNN